MAMNNQFISHVSSELNILRSEGLFKKERVINTPQSSTVAPVSYTHLRAHET